MAEARHIFGPNQQSGLEELAGGSPVAHNVVIEPNGAVRRRPGIQAYSGAPSDAIDDRGIAALHVTHAGQLYAVSAAEANTATIYRVTAGASAAFAGVAANLVGEGRPVIAETERLLVLAAGGPIQKIDFGAMQSARLEGEPPNATHVVAHGSRLVCNDTIADRTVVRYSGTARGLTTHEGHETWSGVGTDTGQFGADARPDPIVAVHETSDAVFMFGSTTVQAYGLDPVYVYAPVAKLELGCAAPYSIIKRDDAFFWLDSQRRFVRSTGRSYEVISGPAIAQTLQDLSAVSDCFGYYVKHGFVDALVWTFPTAGITLAHQLGGGWSQWSGWSGSGWAPFAVNAHHLRSGSAENLVGTRDGKVGVLSRAAHTDLGDRIQAWVTTGFISHDTDRMKRCRAIRLALRRGQTTGDEPRGVLEWRDNLGPWVGQLPVSLGRSGETEPGVEFLGLGTYRRRQWRFRFDGTDELVLAAVREEYEVLDY